MHVYMISITWMKQKYIEKSPATDHITFSSKDQRRNIAELSSDENKDSSSDENSISQTNAKDNNSDGNVTQLQQSKRQMAFTDESDELFERPVNNTPILSAEEIV